MTKREKQLAVAVLLSVALNLFLLGFAVARKTGRPPRDREPPGLVGPRALRETAPPAAREAMRKHADSLRPRQQALASAREEVRLALGGEPFQRERAEGALARLRTETLALQEETHGMLLSVAEGLPPHERLAWLERHFHRRRGRPKDAP